MLFFVFYFRCFGYDGFVIIEEDDENYFIILYVVVEVLCGEIYDKLLKFGEIVWIMIGVKVLDNVLKIIMFE